MALQFDTVSRDTLPMVEACRRLGISPAHGYALAHEGGFPCRTLWLGRRVLVMRQDFEELINQPLSAAQALVAS